DPLIATLLRLYREDPDPGLHGAAEWLLRQWKQEKALKGEEEKWVKEKQAREERLAGVRQEVTKRSAKAMSRWYVNGQGQTMVVIPGPVKFQMGSPPTEAGREGGAVGRTETQHKKRISRWFAIASKEVTVRQFLRFRPRHIYNQDYSPKEDSPVNGV